MNTIDLAEAILKQYPNLTYSVEGGTITVTPPTNDGFSVSLSLDKPEGEFVVSFDIWALGMENECAALNCFVWGLSNRCRLKVEKRGSKASVWVAEFKRGTEWIGLGRRIVMIFVPFWRKKSVEYLQNFLIEDTQGFGPSFNPEEGATAVIKLLENAGVQYTPKKSLEEEYHQNMEAEPLYQGALAINEKALGLEHSAVTANLDIDHDNGPSSFANTGRTDDTKWRFHLGAAQFANQYGNYKEAVRQNKAALKKAKAFGDLDPRLANTLSNLAVIYYDQGHYAKAEPLYQRALRINEKALSPDHPDVATDLNNLATLYYDQGHSTEAEPLYQRSLAIREKALGAEHPLVAMSLSNLAVIYDARGHSTEAESFYQRSLAIREKALGSEHPDVANSLKSLALLYAAQGRYAEAEPLYQRSLAIAEKAVDPEHPSIGGVLNNLAELYRAQGRYAEAEPLYQRSLANREKALGPEHPDVAESLENYAALLHKIGRSKEAEEMETRSKAIRARHAQDN